VPKPDNGIDKSREKWFIELMKGGKFIKLFSFLIYSSIDCMKILGTNQKCHIVIVIGRGCDGGE